jgi:Fe-S oxidoreductase
MARYKSEVLYRSYQGRFRPVSHYSLGQLPRWLSLLDRCPPFVPTAVNAVLGVRRIERLVLRAGGMDPRRRTPRLAPVSFRRSWQRSRIAETVQDNRDPVVLWADSFTDRMNPEVARAAADVLAAAGHRVIVPDRVACCGLTWITTGQLDGARTRLRRLMEILEPYAAQGIPIVGLEPSCTAVLRSDLADLFPGDPRAAQMGAAARTLAEQLASRTTTTDWQPPDLTGLELLVQPHCHHHSVMGFADDQKLLTDSGATVTTLAGCCGLAGNFGMEAGHYDTSVAIAENGLLPALRGRSEGSIVLADGFSCRTQIQHLAGATSLTLAQLLARHLPEPR